MLLSRLFTPESTSTTHHAASCKDAVKLIEDHNKLSILLLGNYHPHKKQVLECLVNEKFLPRVAILYRFYNCEIKRSASGIPLKILLADSADQDRFRNLLAIGFNVYDLVLACISDKTEITSYLAMAAASTKPNTPLLFIVDDKHQDLLAEVPANTVIFKADDTNDSFFARIFQKLKEMAALESQPDKSPAASR